MEIMMLIFCIVSAVAGVICAYFAYKTYKNDHKD